MGGGNHVWKKEITEIKETTYILGRDKKETKNDLSQKKVSEIKETTHFYILYKYI